MTEPQALCVIRIFYFWLICSQVTQSSDKLLLGNLRTSRERVILPSSLTNQHSVILPSMLLKRNYSFRINFVSYLEATICIKQRDLGFVCNFVVKYLSSSEGSSFCSFRWAFPQNEDPINFFVLASNKAFQQIFLPSSINISRIHRFKSSVFGPRFEDIRNHNRNSKVVKWRSCYENLRKK